MAKKSKKIFRFFMTGLKLALVLVLGSVIMLVPYLINLTFILLNPLLYVVLNLVFVLMGFVVDGWLVVKYRRWIFKGVKH